MQHCRNPGFHHLRTNRPTCHSHKPLLAETPNHNENPNTPRHLMNPPSLTSLRRSLPKSNILTTTARSHRRYSPLTMTVSETMPLLSPSARPAPSAVPSTSRGPAVRI